MALEIERKFLVVDASWRASCVRRERLVDGMLATSKGRKVRIRINGAHATICIKSRKSARVRHEFEYPMPLADAQHLIDNDCRGEVLAKTRHFVPYAGFTWEVDVYETGQASVTIAEVELPAEDVLPPLPPWVGREITGDARFSKTALRMHKRNGDWRELARLARRECVKPEAVLVSSSEAESQNHRRRVPDGTARRFPRGGEASVVADSERLQRALD